MTGHAAWRRSHASPTTEKAIRLNLEYVRGYILALEDIADDITQLALAPDAPAADALEQVQQQIATTLESARRTSDYFIQRLDEINDQAQSPVGNSD